MNRYKKHIQYCQDNFVGKVRLIDKVSF